jgi:hypothetical protein
MSVSIFSPQQNSPNGGFQANQIRCQLRQPFRSILGPAIGDGDIVALDKARFLQALAERDETIPNRLWRSDIEEADKWHRRLLRARCERPRRHTA